MSLNQVLSHFQKNQDTHIEDLKGLVAVPSISFPGFDMAKVEESARCVAELLKRRGLENVQILTGPGNPRPYVYGDWLRAPGKPTILLYAHHDVQPVGDEEKWKSAPFEATVREGRLYGRGAADDKAGVVTITAAVASWLETVGSLPVNVKLIIEGEEEIGSPGLEDFLKLHQDKLSADILVLTDTDNYSTERPGLTVALRGIVALGVEVEALKQSLHSGMWGGPVPDPAMALSKMLASLVDEEGEIAIEGILDQVRPLTDHQRRDLKDLNESDRDFCRQAGLVEGAQLLKGKFEAKEKIWHRPALTINAIEVSNRKNAANIIAASAWAKVSIRIVPDMDPQEVVHKLEAHLRKVCPWGLKLKIESEGVGKWWTTEITHPVFELAAKAMEEGWGKAPLFMGCGGSIPFVETLTNALGGVPALLIGIEDPETFAHSENESLHLGVFEKTVKSQIRFMEYVGQMKTV